MLRIHMVGFRCNQKNHINITFIVVIIIRAPERPSVHSTHSVSCFSLLFPEPSAYHKFRPISKSSINPIFPSRPAHRLVYRISLQKAQTLLKEDKRTIPESTYTSKVIRARQSIILLMGTNYVTNSRNSRGDRNQNNSRRPSSLCKLPIGTNR